MMLSEMDNNKMNSLCNTGSKAYWLPIITGHMLQCVSGYMNSQGFKYVKVPLLNPVVTKKDINLPVQYGTEKLELSSSNALHLGAMSAIYNKVYSNTTVFRNEHFNENSHLIEFELLEAEWIENDENILISFLEDLIAYAANCYNMFLAEKDIIDIFPMAEVILPLEQMKYDNIPQFCIDKGVDLVADDKGFYDNSITYVLDKPCWISYYPPKASWRAKRQDERHCYAFNVILPQGYGELIECSIRETNPEIVANKLKMAKIERELEWYIKASICNPSPRCGFGLGIERLCKWFTKTSDIADTQAFPRKPEYFGGKVNVSQF